MGEIAEMMLDGTLCACCGEYLDQGSAGFPQYCLGCEPTYESAGYPTTTRGRGPLNRPSKVNCSICNKLVKKAGLADHTRDKHGES